MLEASAKPTKKYDKKHKDIIRKNLYTETAKNAMKSVSEFDSMIIKANDNYIDVLVQADKPEYDILQENMAKADTAEERQAIRDRMAEMKKERYAKDTENKGFHENREKSYKNYTLQILTSVVAVTGLAYKYRKPLANMGKKLISK